MRRLQGTQCELSGVYFTTKAATSDREMRSIEFYACVVVVSRADEPLVPDVDVSVVGGLSTVPAWIIQGSTGIRYWGCAGEAPSDDANACDLFPCLFLAG